MFAGVSGLRNHQLKMDVIGNNIANVNTAGYKASRIVFQEMFSQTINNASAPSGNTGGVNPKQVGLGVRTASIDVQHSTGSAQSTENPLDFMIDGEGFFVIQDGTEIYYTRAGNFYLDTEGYLVTANGAYVLGLGGQNVNALTGEVTYPAGGTKTKSVDGTYSLANLFTSRIPDTDYYSSYTIDKSGTVYAIETNGSALVTIGQIAIATFVNPEGLTRVGDNLYVSSSNSGTPRYKEPDTEGAGPLLGGTLEMSNVDLSREFTEMIITQRGFQANSRVITVSDTLLEELINLKR